MGSTGGYAIMSNRGINWTDISILSNRGINWSDVAVISNAGDKLE